MDKVKNEFVFAKEYLCEWIHNGNYDKAYELWVKYHYECERWDEFVCTGNRDESGFIKPINDYERSKSNFFATEKRKEIMALARHYEISQDTMRSANKEVSRLTLSGLVSEYNRIFKIK